MVVSFLDVLIYTPAPVLPQGGSLPPWHLYFIFECDLVLITIEKWIDPILISKYKVFNFHPIKSVPNKKGRNAQSVKIVLGNFSHS